MYRIGTQIWPNDPFWVQVQEAIQQGAQQHAVELVALVIDNPDQPSDEELGRMVEELLAQDLDALIGWNLSKRLAQHILDSGLAIVDLTETDFRHPRLASPLGLYLLQDSSALISPSVCPSMARWYPSAERRVRSMVGWSAYATRYGGILTCAWCISRAHGATSTRTHRSTKLSSGCLARSTRSSASPIRWPWPHAMPAARSA
jgi:hypothetical protein